MYGLDTVQWTTKDLGKLEVVQWKTGRRTLGVNKYALSMNTDDMGWKTFKERSAQGKVSSKMNGGGEVHEHERWMGGAEIEAGV